MTKEKLKVEAEWKHYKRKEIRKIRKPTRTVFSNFDSLIKTFPLIMYSDRVVVTISLLTLPIQDFVAGKLVEPKTRRTLYSVSVSNPKGIYCSRHATHTNDQYN